MDPDRLKQAVQDFNQRYYDAGPEMDWKNMRASEYETEVAYLALEVAGDDSEFAKAILSCPEADGFMMGDAKRKVDRIAAKMRQAQETPPSFNPVESVSKFVKSLQE